jgi:hypothetical protein
LSPLTSQPPHALSQTGNRTATRAFTLRFTRNYNVSRTTRINISNWYVCVVYAININPTFLLLGDVHGSGSSEMIRTRTCSLRITGTAPRCIKCAFTNCHYAMVTLAWCPVSSSRTGPAFAHGTTGAKRTVGAPLPPPPQYIKICTKKTRSFAIL